MHPGSGKIRVLLIDDHVVMRSGLKMLLQSDPTLEVVGEADDGRAGLALAKSLSPQVVVMDLRMPEMNGIETTRRLLEQNRDVRVVALSANTDRQSVMEILRAGAKAYVRKDSASAELLQAITAVMQGKVFLAPSVASVVVENGLYEHGALESAYTLLSSREREVLQLIAEGKATKEAALCLNVSVKTVETHRRNLMEKLNIDSVAELTKYAVREGISSL